MALLPLAIQLLGGGLGGGIRGDHGPELRAVPVQRIDPVQVGVGEGPRRDLALLHPAGQLGDRDLLQLERRIGHDHRDATASSARPCG
jgi:hypothetical protein